MNHAFICACYGYALEYKDENQKKQTLYRKETTAKRAHIHIAVLAKNARGYILIHKFTHSQING